jgi:hypothetical protein
LKRRCKCKFFEQTVFYIGIREEQMTDIFEVFAVGYGLNSVRLFETDDVEKASDCCAKNNREILASGIPGEALCLHPQYQYYRNIK